MVKDQDVVDGSKFVKEENVTIKMFVVIGENIMVIQQDLKENVQLKNFSVKK